ncbi:HNH endonuclease [Peribacillus sp. ACCC06369]|uniref:HNH endonuclease n=1 Tax=Peribacillus sp. ACCC06369 TaxID=3055860 RepID=UPI0025A0C521|nr:HNH endonuclease [Peribacillus sp. ACCC06369]MDM5359689.1 HNH endonuclease [Peribacillus sp. ACCC06369]
MGGRRVTICDYCNTMVEGSVMNCKCAWRTQRRPKKDIEQNKELTTTKWKKFRKQIIERDGAHCQRCLAKYNLIRGFTLQVHHIKPRIRYPELTYEATNCVTLCQQCNTEYGTKEQLDFDFTPKEIGDIYVL